jgi:hypothetical protein
MFLLLSIVILSLISTCHLNFFILFIDFVLAEFLFLFFFGLIFFILGSQFFLVFWKYKYGVYFIYLCGVWFCLAMFEENYPNSNKDIRERWDPVYWSLISFWCWDLQQKSGYRRWEVSIFGIMIIAQIISLMQIN